MNSPTELEFIAQLVNRNESFEKGYAVATLWSSTNEDHKKYCLDKAKKIFEDWKNSELSAQKKMDEITASIKIINVCKNE